MQSGAIRWHSQPGLLGKVEPILDEIPINAGSEELVEFKGIATVCEAVLV
jgi:hypothetical protein